MTLTCSLFGHDYTEHDAERERTDHGTEVVTTLRTTKTCRRCDHTQVLSENTEITAANVGEADVDGDTGVEPTAATAASARGSNGGISIDGGGSIGPTAAAASNRSLASSELRCPACGFGESLLGSALRAGDSCPECTRGYLVRRTRKG